MLTGAITATSLDFDLGIEGAFAVQCANYLLGIHDGDIGIGLNVGSSNRTRLVDTDLEGQGFTLMRNDENLFQVEDDIGDIFHHTVDALEFVADALDFN